MQGKRIVITGPTAGIGRETALELGRRGAQLTLLCRNRDKGEALAAEIAGQGGATPQVIPLDMASLASVRAAGQALVERGEPIDVLINNAGLINTERRESVDGFEETLAVNHFAPFVLTGLLLPLLQAEPASRIVNVASDAHKFVRGMGFDDMQAEQGFRTFREYGRSKLANMLFTLSLAERLGERGPTVNCLHPGAVSTSLGSQNDGVLSGLLPLLLKPFFKSPQQGAQTTLFLACDPAVAQVSGKYFVNSREVSPKPWALDREAADRLWRYTEECTGFCYWL
ncbi:SDR family oxidoreductase [Parahaliea aestuarii]|uniref:SDR family oxidoreductase n=1 Tax=Parahaliea aestuarii TaxID=1852021 RepID=A0A5C8ZR76_9GAMM|nr:SDR family oxidoreductase [Parahaliea aestuarii]TXS91003.1 SDR family oxidoreductase [Parahaliea aestuarii]